MYKTIAVEDGLDNVIQALHAGGFKTTPLEGEKLQNVRAAVVKGNGTSLIAPDWPVKMPIINAAGRSADEVLDILRDRLS
ncbi:YkuS family protein [Desulfosporosinus sp. BICA1-9]|uniref:YkuS family protein n=1 Tax=Desulfosporosinus sp. BICA1-9 TaxID=1531958 RepID=UPI00054C093E|nr:YkuS family protein [Desulfosporosinus sp. BICA1-9]KJS49081.1 MAG: hypothetical protein VR66_10485 [Peptococcaceae bacterium BRH_c23]KJS88886.1 MAG: hypothetical protein JL57_10140 [Desulfosporosinus sp. BICA1-9]HBW36681.1 hypothetical protein [Desulfosporosinus sp.]